MIDDAPAHIAGPFAVLGAAAVTDVLDGHLARRSGATSGVGSWLDPICDKLFVGAVLVALLSIAVEVAFGAFERIAVSAGLRQARDVTDVRIQERPR